MSEGGGILKVVGEGEGGRYLSLKCRFCSCFAPNILINSEYNEVHH